MAQSTKDYKQFKLMGANREVNEKHVKQLSKSIQVNKNLLQARPILVNENYEIIDGQHRYTAAKELGIEVWYEVVKGLTADDAITLNRNQTNWNLTDYARSHAAAGKADYKKYLELLEEYPTINPTTVMTILAGKAMKGQTVEFREGKFVINDLTQAIDYLDQLEELIDVDPRVKLRSVAESFLRVFKSESYDHKRMVNKMTQWADAQFNPYGQQADILRSIENVYNFHQSEKARLY